MENEKDLSKLEDIISKEVAGFFFKNQVEPKDGLLILSSILIKSIFLCKVRVNLDPYQYIDSLKDFYAETEPFQRKHIIEYIQKLKDEEVNL